MKKLELLKSIKEEIKQKIKYRREYANKFGEVFTDFELVEEHVSNIDEELFKDPTSTFLDPCAGWGQYPIVLIEKLMIGLEEWEPNEEKRWKWILENQIFMVEIQKESCDIIQEFINPSGELKLNLFNENFLEWEY